jgi:hypothetical protein
MVDTSKYGRNFHKECVVFVKWWTLANMDAILIRKV